uniref:AB hydrolase-1 domain-containing protein n=1 Tax=Zea mays TaxID=4577 RepID=A0A804QA03_MAIZE
MVNLVHVAKKQLVQRLAKMAGLRQRAVDVDDAGTVISIWVPKDKLPAGPTAEEMETERRKKETKRNGGRLSVVLLHGFAGDGILTWVLQVVALARHYDVYVPDLLFFGGSVSPAGADQTPGFQAECVASALRRLGVERCVAVGFSYGGFVAFKMAEADPALVVSVVATGSLVYMTRSTSEAMLRRLGAASFAEFLLPNDVAGLKSLFAAGTYRKWWLPDRVLSDYMKLMIFNRKERTQLLEGLVVSDEDAAVVVRSYRQEILLLWGDNDSIFNMELARSLKEQLGEKATLRSIAKAGHLVMLERPRVFNGCLREFLLRQSR